MPTRAVNWTELRALANRPDTLVIVGMLLRPGVRVFGAALREREDRQILEIEAKVKREREERDAD